VRLEEQALWPHWSICDAHVHLWPDDQPAYTFDDLHADTTSGHRIRSVVHVESGRRYRTGGHPSFRPVGETEWIARLQGAEAVQGIVGFADLTIGDAVEDLLNAHLEAGRGLFRGVRHGAAWHSHPAIPNHPAARSPDLLGDPAFNRGLAALGRLGLSFDAWVYFTQLPDLVQLARDHPEVEIVVDHFGAPLGTGPYAGRREEVWELIRRSTRELAQLDNVFVKLGGLGYPAFGFDWHTRPTPVSSAEIAKTWQPLQSWCVDVFGPQRCMCESNFPPDRASCSYSALWNAHKLMVADLGVDERAAVLHDTAARFYRIDPA
jgi:predicted TIM-barrel fold metal-dependent hydrolase